jgi:hypothetical protein
MAAMAGEGKGLPAASLPPYNRPAMPPSLPERRRDQPDDFDEDSFEAEVADGAVDDEGDVDPEGPDPSEMDSSDDPDLEVCPHCRKLVYEDAERCPHCGRYISAENMPMSPVAWMVIGIVALLILGFLLSRF